MLISGRQIGQISIPNAFIQNLPSSGPCSPKSGYFCAPAEASTYRAAFEIFLCQGVLPANSTVRRTCLAIARETMKAAIDAGLRWA